MIQKTCDLIKCEEDNHTAGAPGAAMVSPWDFLPKVLVFSSGSLEKVECRAKAFSGDKHIAEACSG